MALTASAAFSRERRCQWRCRPCTPHAPRASHDGGGSGRRRVGQSDGLCPSRGRPTGFLVSDATRVAAELGIAKRKLAAQTETVGRSAKHLRPSRQDELVRCAFGGWRSRTFGRRREDWLTSLRISRRRPKPSRGSRNPSLDSRPRCGSRHRLRSAAKKGSSRRKCEHPDTQQD